MFHPAISVLVAIFPKLNFLSSAFTKLDKKIKMPNQKGFLLPDPRPDIANTDGKPCMENCKVPTKIIGKARDIDVTPEEEKS